MQPCRQPHCSLVEGCEHYMQDEGCLSCGCLVVPSSVRSFVLCPSPHIFCCHTDDEEDAEFYYNEEEVLAGAQGEQRAAMLDHYDSLLQMPRAAELDEVLAMPICSCKILAILLITSPIAQPIMAQHLHSACWGEDFNH